MSTTENYKAENVNIGLLVSIPQGTKRGYERVEFVELPLIFVLQLLGETRCSFFLPPPPSLHPSQFLSFLYSFFPVPSPCKCVWLILTPIRWFQVLDSSNATTSLSPWNQRMVTAFYHFPDPYLLIRLDSELFQYGLSQFSAFCWSCLSMSCWFSHSWIIPQSFTDLATVLSS